MNVYGCRWTLNVHWMPCFKTDSDESRFSQTELEAPPVFLLVITVLVGVASAVFATLASVFDPRTLELTYKAVKAIEHSHGTTKTVKAGF